MAGEAKTIGDLIVTIRDEGDRDDSYFEALTEGLDKLTDVVKSFGKFVVLQSMILDNYVKQSDNHIKELIEDIRRANEQDKVRSGGPIGEPVGDQGGPIDAGDAEKKTSVFSKVLGGIFGAIGSSASSLFSPITKTLSSAFSLIASPLAGIARLFMRAGPIGLVIFGMYEIFKDISENPIFTETMENIKNTFNERIVPTFNRIVESITSLIEPGTMIGDWFNNFRIQIQDFVIETLGTLTNVVAGVLEGVDLLLNGEWSAGISSIVSSVFWGVYDLFDSLLTNILEVFGVDFGAEGSLFQSIGTSISDLGTAIAQTWDGIKTLVLDSWNAFMGTLMSTITAVFNTVGESVTNVFTAFKEDGVLAGVMTLLTEQFSLIVTKPLDLIKDLAAWVAEQFGFDKAAEWLSSFSLDEAFRSFADFLTEIPQMLIDYAQEMWIDIWAKFKKGLVNLGAWISSIPDRIYLNAIDYLNNTSGVGYLIDDDAVESAKQAVASRDADTSQKLKQIDLDAENQRRALVQSQADRVSQNATAAAVAARTPTGGGMNYAPTTVNTGGNVTSAPTTYNTVVNPSTGLDTPPYLLGGGH